MTDRSTVKTVAVVTALLIAAGVAAAATADVSISLSSNDDGAVLQTGTDVAVNLTGNTDVYYESGRVSSDTIQWNTTAGNLTATGSGTANVTVDKDDITGTWTNLSNLDVDQNDVTINPEDKVRITVGQDAETLAWTTMAIDDGSADFTFSGSSGQTEVTLYGLPANTEVGAMDVKHDDALDVATTDANGQVTFVMPNSDHTVELQTNDGPPEASNIKPKDDYETNQENVTFEIDVDDPDFPEDDVNATLFTRDPTQSSFTKAYETEVDTNGTVSTTESLSLGGGHDYYWNLTDAYGATTETTERTVFVPDTLYIYNVTSTNKITDEVTITATTEEQVIERTTTDGTVSFEGFPVTDIITIEASSQDYHDRQTVVRSIFQQQAIYLLNTTFQSYEVRFTLTDNTGGLFSQNDPTVSVQRPLNKSGDVEWVAVGGGRFGVQGYTTQLEADQQYKLIVRNNDGDSRTFFPYTASAAEVVPLDIVSFDTDTDEGDSYTAQAYYNNSTNGRFVQFDYVDDDNATETLWVKIYERNNESNVLKQNTSYDGPLGTISITRSIPDKHRNATWVVDWVADRGDTNGHGKENVGPQRSVLERLPVWLLTIISLGSILVVGGLFSAANGAIGGIVTAAMGGLFWYVDLLPPAVDVGVVVLALVAAAMIFIRTRRVS